MQTANCVEEAQVWQKLDRNPRRNLVDGRRRRLRWRRPILVVASDAGPLVAGQVAPGTRIQYVHEHGHDQKDHGDGKAAVIAAPCDLRLLRSASGD